MLTNVSNSVTNEFVSRDLMKLLHEQTDERKNAKQEGNYTKNLAVCVQVSL